jgi:hypothetical protein
MGGYLDAAFYKNELGSARTDANAPETLFAGYAGLEQERTTGMVMWNAVSTLE